MYTETHNFANNTNASSQSSTTFVKDEMISGDDLVSLALTEGQTLESLNYADIKYGMGDYPRLLVLNPDQSFAALIHKAALHSALFEMCTESMQICKEPYDISLNDIKTSQPQIFASFITNAILVSETTSLGAARVAMVAARNSQDIIITPTGEQAEAVSGWITDTLLLHKLCH